MSKLGKSFTQKKYEFAVLTMFFQMIQHKVSLKVRTLYVLLLAIICITTGFILNNVSSPIKAASEPSFTFTASSSDDDLYGVNLTTLGEYRYYFTGSVSDDSAEITTLEVEIDNEGREDISGDVLTGSLDSNSEDFEYYFDQVQFADSLPHTITFYATNSLSEEGSQQFQFQITPETVAPSFVFDTSDSGTVSTATLHYNFTVTDDYFVNAVTGYIDAPQNPISISRLSGEYNEWYSEVPVDITGYTDGNEHIIYFEALDAYNNSQVESFSFTYSAADENPPVFSFSTSTSGATDAYFSYIGSVEETESRVTSLGFTFDNSERYNINPIDGSTDQIWLFNLPLENAAEGAHTITFYATDENNNESTSVFNVNVDATPPSCEPAWYNQISPFYSKSITYSSITCTDSNGITDAAFSVYHAGWGSLEILGDNHILPIDGTFGGTTETFTFTIDLTDEGNIDGRIFNDLYVYDAVGNGGFNEDPLVMESTDSTAPVVNLDEVLPDSLTDTTPTIIGSCVDNAYRDTNTNIANLEYKIDSGSYTAIDPPEGQTYGDDTYEDFHFMLPELTVAEHTVTVRCTDASGLSSETDDTFTIADPVDPVPGEYSFFETFENHDNMDLPSSSNVIWGNGKLRLKESITTTRTLISDERKCSQYADDCRGDWSIHVDPQDPNVLWYLQGGKFYTYNTQTNTNAIYNYESIFGVASLDRQVNSFALGVYDGKKYLIAGDSYSLLVLNITDGVGFVHGTITGYFGSIALDFDRGRMGAYMVITATAGNSDLGYIDFKGTMDQSDDELTPIPLAQLNSVGIFNAMIDPVHNAIYSGAAGYGIYKFNDNNNPSDPASYTVTSYVGYSEVYGSMILDPENRLVFGTSINSAGRVFVVTDDGDTPFDATDDTVTPLSDPIQLGYKDVRGLQYMPGQNGIGDQLFITTENDNPVYLNFNDTYENRNDDTFIELSTNGGVRPNGSVLHVMDYNTMYANNPRQGFYKIDLNRDWQSSGTAVALPTRPAQQLVVDNFVAQANVVGTIASTNTPSNGTFLSRLFTSFIPQVFANAQDGVRYYVSTDGGLTWREVTLNQLQQLQQDDYKLKFKIEMTPVNGASPVLDSYSLSYAGYPTPEDASTTTTLTVQNSATSTTTNSGFSVTVQGVDTLGFKIPDYSQTATLSLIDTSTSSVVSGLSVSEANIQSGTVTLTDVKISRTGTFRIRASDGTYTGESSPITVTDSSTSIPSPQLTFYADSYLLSPGQTTTLHWSGSNVSSFTLTPGDTVFTSNPGTYTVSPNQTTTYTLKATGDHGSITNILLIKVSGSTVSTASPTPSPRPSSASTSEQLPLEENQLSLDVSNDLTIVKGQKASISWKALHADSVEIDYLDYAPSLEGRYEFFPQETTTISIAALQGDNRITKEVVITVIDASVPVQQGARTLQERLPWASGLVTVLIQISTWIPTMGVGAAVIAHATLSGLLLLTVITQNSLMALNGKTIASALRVAGILPFKKRKGIVHEAKTGKPIPFATINVLDELQKGSLIATLVSDVYGYYFEPYLSSGKYKFVVAHDKHTFPTTHPRPPALGIKDYYKGEVLSISSNRYQQSLLIPMDGTTASTNSGRTLILHTLSRLLMWLEWTIYPLFILSVLACIVSPNPFNGLILGIYMIMVALRVRKLLTVPMLVGTVVENGSRIPLENISIVLNQENGLFVGISKTDNRGNFSFFVKPGSYGLSVVTDSYYWSSQQLGALYVVKVSNSQQHIQISLDKIRY